SLDVAEGETVVLVGPSGCGKTTTMRMINRLIEPTSGQILIGDDDVLALNEVELRRRIGYVIQQIGLFPHLTIAANIALVPRMLKWEKKRTSERVDELLELVGLDPADFRHRFPRQLSGGQQQRIGVARALAADPPLMLMDEPFGAVDPITRERLQNEFLALQEQLKKTIVFVTHDIDEAIKMADRIAILNIGGVLEQHAPPEEILREPASAFVEEFVGAERGLKRLALIKVSEIGVDEGPVVSSHDDVEKAVAVIRGAGFGWASVIEDGELLGWVDERMLEGTSQVAEATPRRFSAYVTADNSLRQALDSIVTSRTNVAVVVSEGQRYRGILTLERVSREIVS
ncbi:MAG: ABC transporter ATP-binding protein, partial [Pseudonocardiaceae bacterium]